jgi:putative flippase GtrA
VKHLLDSESARPFRYLVTGGVAWLVDLTVFTFLLPLTGIVSAQFVARIAGAIVAFLGHKLFVFRALDRSPAALATQTLGYAALWVLAYGLSAAALVILIGHLNWNTIAAKFVVEVGIVLMNYTVMKTLIFLPPQNREKDE